MNVSFPNFCGLSVAENRLLWPFTYGRAWFTCCVIISLLWHNHLFFGLGRYIASLRKGRSRFVNSFLYISVISLFQLHWRRWDFNCLDGMGWYIRRTKGRLFWSQRNWLFSISSRIIGDRWTSSWFWAMSASSGASRFISYILLVMYAILNIWSWKLLSFQDQIFRDHLKVITATPWNF